MTPPAARALVLTAGYGTRLRPLTHDRAKAAVPIAGAPLIDRILRWSAGQGVRDVVLNLHYRPESITSLVGDGSASGANVRYSFERRLLGSAGGPRHALSLMDSRFFLINGDTLTDLDLHDLERGHDRSGASVTLAVVPHPAPGRYGGILADSTGRVLGFSRRGDREAGWHFIGVQVASARVFEDLPDATPASTIPDLYTQLLSHSPEAVRVHPVRASFHDVGSPAEYLRTCLAIAAQESGSSPHGDGCVIDPAASVTRSVLWDRVHVGPNAVVSECIVCEDARLPAGIRLERSIIMAAARVPPAAEGTRIGDLVVTPLGGT